MTGTLAERLWQKVDKRPGGCWLWTARVNNHGYGEISRGTHIGSPLLAHRAVYELMVGPIPAGLELDHLCRHPSCVNPAHLEPVTHSENIRRGLPGQSKAHCKRGHILDGNVYISVRGARTCRVCAIARAAKRRADAKLIPEPTPEVVAP